MRIVYHLGAHCTDEEKLLRCLLKNRGVLAQQGIAVPAPSRYRNLLRDNALGLGKRAATPQSQSFLLSQILDGDALPDRLVLSWDSFIAYPQWALHGGFYARAGQNLRRLTEVLPDYPSEFHLAIRNPAGLIPALLQRQREKTYDDLMGDMHPQDLFWSDVLYNIRDANPDIPIHVWCDEDSPLVWPDVLRLIAGHSPDLVLDGINDFLSNLLTPSDLQRLTQELERRAKGNVALRRQLTADFLEQNALPERMETLVELPGWSEELIDTMTRQYDQDLIRIARIPDLRLTLP